MQNLDTWMCKIPKKSITPLSTFSGNLGREFSNSQGILARLHTWAKHTRICKFTHFPGISYTILQEQKSQAYARGTWGHEKRNWDCGQNDPLSIIWGFWDCELSELLTGFRAQFFNPMSWRCLASVLSITMHKSRVRPQSGVLSLK